MNKASGGDGIPVELFQILEDVAVKVLHSYASKFGKLSSGHRTGKGQFSFQSQRKAMRKNTQTTAQLHSSQGRGAWWAAVYGVAQSRTQLKQLSSSNSTRQ